MKLKGIRTIALLVAAVILVIGSVAGLTVVRDRCGSDDLGYDAGGIAPGHHCGVHHDPIARVQDIPGPDYGAGEEYPACKCYYDIWKCTTSRWWEVLPLTPYQREQVREIMLHVFDYHVGLEIRGMSACAFRGLATSMCPTLWEEGLRAFWYYAQERGLDFPRRILKAARQPTPPFIPPPDAYYWWEFVRPERRESQIRVTKRDLEVRREYAMRRYWYEIPEVDIMTLTPEQLRCLFDIPRLERRPWLLPLEEIRYTPGAIAVHGEVRQGLTKAEVLQWMDALHKVRDLLCLYMLLENLPEDIEAPYPRYIIDSFATQIYGTLVLNFNTCNLTLEEAHSLIPGFYAKIAAKAEEIGIEAVPVVFTYGRVTLDLAQEDWGTSGSPPHPSYDLRYRPIIGGILHEITNAEGWGTIGFSVARPCPQRGWTVDYAITGHAGPTHRPTRVGAAVWQPRRLGGGVLSWRPPPA
ncbi:hypothetical protein M1O20_07320 [Dehalococcoidia bacterium]|nr:hypothetical protein [Dehalococcoidia bacterium]